MSIKSIWNNVNPGKLLGYGVAASASVPAVMDIFQMATGDMSASASFAQNFSIMAAGFGIAQSGNTNQPQREPAPATGRLIIPRRDFVIV